MTMQQIVLDVGPRLDVQAVEAGHVWEEVTHGGHEAEVSGRVQLETGDCITTQERGPAGHHLSPQHGLASDLQG